MIRETIGTSIGDDLSKLSQGVEEKIASIDGISHVEVSLEKAEASFTSSAQISVDLLTSTLGQNILLTLS